jgi:hypothetical protein
MVLKKRNKQVEEIEKFGREGVWRVIFSSSGSFHLFSIWREIYTRKN